tara:strand:+ start:8661 stop:9857 length:1197 start_codon:yes stop_codon:yes gene_type:complete
MNELKKVYTISISINKETTIDTGNNNNILKENSLSYGSSIGSDVGKYKDENNLEYVYVGETDSLNVKYNSNIKGSDIQDKLLYRHPNLTLPRSKVEILKDKYNVRVIRDASKSDYQIISKKYIDSMFVRQWVTIYPKESIVRYINRFSQNLNTEAALSLTKFLEKTSENAYFKIYINRGWSTGFDFISDLVSTSHIESDVCIHNGKYLTNIEAYNNLNNKSNLILDEDVSKICSEDSVIITEEQYESLVSIFKSEDKDNMAIGLEVLANCNIEKSLDKAALLYFHYSDSFRHVKNWNSINVKALRVALDPVGTVSYYSVNLSSYNKLFNFLKKNNSITEFAYKHVLTSISERVLAKIGLTNSEVFELKLSDIKLKSEFAVKQADPNQLIFDEEKMYEF